MLGWSQRNGGQPTVMRCRYVTFVALLTLVACGLTNTADPNFLHVAYVSYSDTACGPASCSGILRFRLLNSAKPGVLAGS